MTLTTTEPTFTLTLSLSEARALKMLVGSIAGSGSTDNPIPIVPAMYPRWTAIYEMTDECYEVLNEALQPFEDHDE
tara:strand:- start:578 stop:805 length:228 start_codon:yes stop_codon:yes gene_type:complete